MKEREFQGWVTEVARRFGWKVWHVPMPMRPIGGGKMVPDTRGRGLPDLIMFHKDPPRLIFAELKGDGRHPISTEQMEFLRLARGVVGAFDDLVAFDQPAGAPTRAPLGVYSWRPGSEDIIEAILRGKVMA